MGLKVSCEQATVARFADARSMVADLHAAATLLPFDDVTSIETLDETTSELDRLFASHGTERFVAPAIEAAWFCVYAEGSETTWIGLASRPSVAPDRDGVEVATGLGDLCTWQWCCKTQYASLPQHGGTDNFLRVHTSLIALADHARSIGLEVDVTDDSNYWELRDPELLVAECERWNRRMAAFAGWLTDRVGDELGKPLAPIMTHPAFERLEAEGREELGLAT